MTERLEGHRLLLRYPGRIVSNYASGVQAAWEGAQLCGIVMLWLLRFQKTTNFAANSSGR